MLSRGPLLVALVKLVDRLPVPEAPRKHARGCPKVYTDRVISKALVIIRRLYSAYSLLAFLDQDTDLTRALRAEPTDEHG